MIRLPGICIWDLYLDINDNLLIHLLIHWRMIDVVMFKDKFRLLLEGKNNIENSSGEQGVWWAPSALFDLAKM